MRREQTSRREGSLSGWGARLGEEEHGGDSSCVAERSWAAARKSEARADEQGTESDGQVRTDGLRFVYRQASDSGQAAVQLINLKRRSEDLMRRGNCHAEPRPCAGGQGAALETCRALEGAATCAHARTRTGRAGEGVVAEGEKG